ncbi:MAG: ATP-dependent helicase [Candidatus Dormibacteria bacterium]
MATVALDSDQQQAVDHRAGPCLVLAGPGSGKTRVIVERFLALESEGVAAPRQLVLTYTRRAADEMRARAEAARGAFTTHSPLSNYHSFAQRVVREWGWLAGISPAFRIADDAERWLHLEAVLAELRPRLLWNPLRAHDLIDPILDVIGKAKQELVTPQAYAAWAATRLQNCDDPAERAVVERHSEVAQVYAALDERYLRHAILDHDDTILRAEQLLREHEAPRHAISEAIEYVMVDEYQDTNYAQARLVETLVASHRNILVVADDDQSIYKFRGASRANIDRFGRTYAGHARVVLSHNYRSTAPIVGAAERVIAAADPASRITKHLVAERGEGEPVELWEAADERSECAGVASECRRLLEQGVRPADIAWLFRRHDDMRPAIAALREAGVPYSVSGGRGFFAQPEIKDLLAILAAVDDPGDTQALLRCVLMPAWRVSNRGRLALVDHCHRSDRPLATVLRDAAAAEGAGVDGLDASDLTGALQCLDDIEQLHLMSTRDDVRDVFYEALERCAYLGMLDQQSALARMQVGANLNKFGELLESFADWSDDRRLGVARRYLEVLRNSRHADEIASIDAAEDGVLLLTAHSAKGLEWPMVFISGIIERRWGRAWTSWSALTLPSDLVPEAAPAGDAAIDEERRLFYVATTRAADRLVLARARRYAGSFKDEAPSPFLRAVSGSSGVRTRDVPESGGALLQPARAKGAWAGGRLTLSVSDLAAFRQCPRRFEYRRRYHMPSPDTVNSWYGTLVHRTLQHAAMRRLAGESVDAGTAAATWHELWEASRGPRGANAALRELGERQLRGYIESPAWRDASISAIEEQFTLALDRADVSGRWDRLDGDGATVVDYKTGTTKSETAVRRDLQVRAYSVAASRRTRSDDVAVELHFVATGEVTRAAFTREELDRSWAFLNATASDLARAWQSGAFPPKPSTWNCRRCAYRTVCDEGHTQNDGA